MQKMFHIRETAIEKDFHFTFGRDLLKEESFEWHSHDYSELILILSGEGIHETEGGDYPVYSGDVFIIHTGEYHGFRRCLNLEMVNIGFPDSVLQEKEFLPLPGFHALFFLEPIFRKQHSFTSRLHLRPSELERIQPILESLGKETRDKGPGFRLAFVSFFQILVLQLCRRYEDREPEGQKELLKIGRSLAVLEQNYLEDISIRELAAEAGYSVNHFSRLCKQIYGLPPLQYIIQLRHSRAVELLESGDLRVSEIAHICGYSDSNYFCRHFKKKTGLSPRDFRLSIQERSLKKCIDN